MAQPRKRQNAPEITQCGTKNSHAQDTVSLQNSSNRSTGSRVIRSPNRPPPEETRPECYRKPIHAPSRPPNTESPRTNEREMCTKGRPWQTPACNVNQHS